MSDTPRTDQEKFYTDESSYSEDSIPTTEVVTASFARELERENVALADKVSRQAIALEEAMKIIFLVGTTGVDRAVRPRNTWMGKYFPHEDM